MISSLYSVYACDSCASGLNSSGVGLLSTYRQNFVGLSWQRSMFETSSDHGHGSKDRFQTVELRLRYQISQRWSVELRQPFKHNTRIEKEDKRVLQGISEPRIQDENLPENFNISNGALGYIVQATPVLTKGNLGLLGNVYYQHNFESSNDYLFGDQLSTQWVMFYRWTVSDIFTLLPFAGVQYESVSQDRYATEYTVNGTGGNGTYAVTAINIKTDKYSLELSYNLPMSGSFSGDKVEAKGRFGALATFFF